MAADAPIAPTNAATMRDDELINKGVIINRPVGPPVRGGRTFIVTGLHRSGTSLVASLLQQAGIFMGRQINDAVSEDEEMGATLLSGDAGALRRLIDERNANHGTWGFKVPEVYTHLHPERLTLFDNPHLIVTFRDIASIAVRNSLSEYKEVMTALRDAVSHLDALVTYIGSVRAPSLLLSYEKALIFPGDFVDTLLLFCGLTSDAALRARLLGLVEPNRKDYLSRARRVYRGRIDGIAHGCVFGWCQRIGSNDPVRLDLFVDDRLVTSFLADVFRQNLLDAKVGAGAHGFVVALTGLQARADAIIRVRVAGRVVELDNSGQRLECYQITPA
jgi:hypothetical protein